MAGGDLQEEPAITDANGPTTATRAPSRQMRSSKKPPPTRTTASPSSSSATTGLAAGTKPTNELEYVRVDLPVGLAVNPGATARCPIETFEASAASCAEQHDRRRKRGHRLGPAIPSPPLNGLTAVKVYNLVPRPGQPARFGLELLGNEVFLEGDIDWSGDYHEGFTIQVPHALPLNLGPLNGLIEGLILKDRLVFNGRAGDGTFLTTPSTCNGRAFLESGSQYSTFLKAMSYAEVEAGATLPAGRRRRARVADPARHLAERTATRSPTRRRSKSRRGPTKRTRPPARR